MHKLRSKSYHRRFGAVAVGLVLAAKAIAGGSIRLEIDQTIGAADTTIFRGESVTLIATYEDAEASARADGTLDHASGDQQVHEWKVWDGSSEPAWGTGSENAGYTTSRTISGADHDAGTEVKTSFDARVSGSSQPGKKSKTIRIVDGKIKLSASEEVLEVDIANPRFVTLKAGLSEKPSTDIVYTFFAGSKAIYTSEPTTKSSYSIDLASESSLETLGTAPAAVRFRVETNQNLNFPVPAGSGEGGGPLDDTDPPVANEADVFWAADLILISSRVVSIPLAPEDREPGHLAIERWSFDRSGSKVVPFGAGASASRDALEEGGYSKDSAWELLNETGWFLAPTFAPAPGTVPVPNVPTGVSVIHPSGNGTEHSVVFTGGGEISIDDKWQVVTDKAKSYPNAEQASGTTFPVIFVNWPNSRYRLPDLLTPGLEGGTNSNTFIRWLAGEASLPVFEPSVRPHPGGSAPSTQTQPPLTQGQPFR